MAKAMIGAGRLAWRIGAGAAALVLLASGAVAVAAGGRAGTPDPSFGHGGRTITSLPHTWAKGRFGPIATAAGGRLLVSYVAKPDLGRMYSAIERLEPDGAPDPSFGEGGSATVPYEVTALAEDAGGGVIYGDDGRVERLTPTGAPDKEFDRRVGYFIGALEVKTIVIDTAGRILVGGHFLPSSRAYAGESDAAIMRFAADGEPDPSFGTKGVAYVEAAYNSNEGEFGLLPDGSMLMVGPTLTHISAGGTVLPGPQVKLGEGAHSLVTFADGGFAVSSFAREVLEPQEDKPGCTITRYQPDGSADPAFAQGGVWKDASLAGCRILAAAEGGLLVRGTIEAAPGQHVPKLIRLTAAGAPLGSFGNAGSATVPLPSQALAGEPATVDAATLTADGHIVVAGGARDAFLVGLEADGASNPALGGAGAVVRSRPLPSSTSVRTVLAEPDGELIVAAATDSGTTARDPIWMRFTAAGQPIPAADGAPFLAVPSVGFELLADGPEDLYSLGYTESPTRGPSVTKYTRSGTVVASFGTNGVAPLPGLRPTSAVVDGDGGVTVFGRVEKSKAMGAYRLTAAGRPDPRFGRHGLATVNIAGNEGGQAFSGLALSGGRVLLVGRGGGRLAVAELGPDGRPRQEFGRGGKLLCGCHGLPPRATKVVARRGAFYILSGWELRRRAAGSVLVKVTAAGTIDRSFGHHGHLATKAGGPVALLAQGRRLIVVGTHGYGVERAKLRAFGLDGTPRRFGNGVTVKSGSLRGEEMAATVQPNGRLVLVGEQPADEDEEAGHALELLGLR